MTRFAVLRRMRVMTVVVILCSMPVSGYAEVYRCVEGDKVVFADAPCGSAAETVEINSPEKTGVEISNESMKSVTKTLEKDRQKRELDRELEEQRLKIEELTAQENPQRNQTGHSRTQAAA